MAQEIKDIILEDYDLVIENGDFKLSNSEMQHIELICVTNLGDWKQYPLQGVGIEKYISSVGQTNALKRAISIQLAADGYKVNQILVKGTNETFEYSIDAVRN